MRSTMRWLSVVGGLCFSWSPPAMAEGTPVDCGGVDCEGIREMKALYEAQMNQVQEKDRYTMDLVEAGFAPAACADGSRAPVPGPGWVAGCRFAYRMTAVSNPPEDSSFTAMAQGVAGTAAAGVKLLIGKPSFEKIVFTLERGGVRRFVGWDECLPAASFTCDAQLREGIRDLRALFTTERAFLQEKDRYSANFAEIGFLPMGCTDGTRAAGPDSSWMGGCRFIYHVELSGPVGPTMTFTATARAISGPIAGTTMKISEAGELTLTPVYGMCQ